MSTVRSLFNFWCSSLFEFIQHLVFLFDTLASHVCIADTEKVMKGENNAQKTKTGTPGYRSTRTLEPEVPHEGVQV